MNIEHKVPKSKKRYINNTFYFDGDLKVATGGLVTSAMPIGKIGGNTTIGHTTI